MSPKPECSQRRILHSRYLADFRVYMDAVRWLEEGLGTPNFGRLLDNVKRAERAFDDARTRLSKHCSGHKCELPGGVE